MFQELDIEISIREINKAIKNLKYSKSAGPDLIINEFLKYGFHVLKPYLHKLFNVISSTGTYPGLRGEGFIIPIFKKGDIENVENYPGITLLSVVDKLFTSILNNRLNDWAENYNVYIEAHAGFRGEMTDNIFILHGLISHCINNNDKLSAAFVDLKTAFDYIMQDMLWFKLVEMSVREKRLNVIKSIYSNLKS